MGNLNWNNEDENIITIYHGSDNPNLTPKYGGGRKNNDYGVGFYVTEDFEQACEWSFSMGKKDGYVYKYELDISELTFLNMDDYESVYWIAMLLKNRGVVRTDKIKAIETEIDKEVKTFCNHFYLDENKYDIVKGYRADDSYFNIIKTFLNDNISTDHIEKFFVMGKLGYQICLKTKKSFDRLIFKNKYKTKELYKNKYDNKVWKVQNEINDIVLNLIKTYGYREYRTMNIENSFYNILKKIKRGEI